MKHKMRIAFLCFCGSRLQDPSESAHTNVSWYISAHFVMLPPLNLPILYPQFLIFATSYQ